MTDQNLSKPLHDRQPASQPNVTTSGSSAADSLDQLFNAARLQQKELVDDNFTKVVMNRLPAKPPLRINKRAFLPDIIGLLVGLLVAWRFFEPQLTTAKWLSLFPSDIAISPSSMLLMSTALSLAAVMAWWSVERKTLF